MKLFSVNVLCKGWIPFLQEEVQTIGILIACVSLLFTLLGFMSLKFLLFISTFVILGRKFLAGGFCCNDIKLTGQTILITGSNTGIGKETAKDLVKRGANVILACRDMTKAEATVREIKEFSSSTSFVLAEKLDLSSFDSIKEFANKILSNYSKLDCLINNAGIMVCPYQKTKEGLEMQMGVNHIGHFLLTKLLLPLLTKGHPARIINVSSMGHTPGVIPLDDFNYEKGYNRFQAYFNSKLANILHVRGLAKRLKGTNVQVFALHPGAVESELGRHLSFLYDVFGRFQHFINKSTFEGAQTTIYCATEAVQQDPYYYSDSEPNPPAPLACDDELAEKLWQLSEKIISTS